MNTLIAFPGYAGRQLPLTRWCSFARIDSGIGR